MTETDAAQRPSRLNPKRWPVRWRITAVSAGLTLIILVCFAVIVGTLATNRIRDDFRNDLLSVTSQLQSNYQLGRDPAVGITGRNLGALVAGDAAFRIVDAGGNVVRQTPHAPDLGPPVNGISQSGPFEVVSVPLDTSSLAGPVYLQYARSRTSLTATIDRLWLFLVGGVIGGTMLATLAGLAVAVSDAIGRIAREIATTRDPSRRVPMPESQDEVAELAQTLDQMLRELDAARSETQQMIQAQREFVADASHELRTPLTSILANLELLEASLAARGGEADEEEIVAGALGSSRRMRRLVADLLLLAKADAGRAGPRRSCDLAEIAAEAISEVRPVAEGHEVVLRSDGPVPIAGNPDDLHRMVLNLVENGVRHTPPGSEITVTVAAQGSNVVLEVADDGPGIPAELAEQIFARFVRGEGPADLAVNSGTGLGLAIVKAVAVAHDGEVALDRSPSGGARFEVRLPLDQRRRADEPAGVA